MVRVSRSDCASNNEGGGSMCRWSPVFEFQQFFNRIIFLYLLGKEEGENDDVLLSDSGTTCMINVKEELKSFMKIQ